MKGVFKSAKFGRYIDHVSYQDKEILIARHYCPEKGLILSLFKKKEQQTDNENENYDHEIFNISNDGCKDASFISYV
jgi:hypothetical protein